ncbi:hypothetical protein RJ639_005984 [Escallonia herrerae]|uniref:Uncharacterized protein n=1 Tax=Escallonia herrerae TaxID=1293975 RepID=A0AA88W5T3_9ASTE|nr:hypothetical protein RJ639_005984 [Escallonia herrerae]
MMQIKEDDKFFSRVMSKESSMKNPSFRVYYGGVAGAVPFMWESQPGTPKHKFSDHSLPPLTPPPSYYSNNNVKHTKKHFSKSKQLWHTLFLRINLKKASQVVMPTSPPSSLDSSSSWSSSLSSMSGVPMTPSKAFRRRRRFLSMGSLDDRIIVDDEEHVSHGSPHSMLCFGVNHRDKEYGGYSVVIMKKALMSMVGRRSG